MSVPLRWFPRLSGIVFAMMTLTRIPDAELAAQPAEQPAHFWEAPKSQIDLDAIGPAEVRLLTNPVVGDGNLATFRVQGSVAPVDYVAPGELARPYLTRGEQEFELVPSGLKVGTSPYTDRKCQVTELPDVLEGLTLLRMKMGHKAIVDARYAIVLSADTTCWVFLAIDERVIEVFRIVGVPSWLEEYSPTGLRIRTDDPVMAQGDVRYAVFAKQSAGGRIALGPQGTPPAETGMYFAFFAQAQ